MSSVFIVNLVRAHCVSLVSYLATVFKWALLLRGGRHGRDVNVSVAKICRHLKHQAA